MNKITASSAASKREKIMQYRKLGASDFEVSVISFGAWQIGDPAYWTSDTESDRERTVFAALDAGINLGLNPDMWRAGSQARIR